MNCEKINFHNFHFLNPYFVSNQILFKKHSKKVSDKDAFHSYYSFDRGNSICSKLDLNKSQQRFRKFLAVISNSKNLYSQEKYIKNISLLHKNIKNKNEHFMRQRNGNNNLISNKNRFS